MKLNRMLIPMIAMMWPQGAHAATFCLAGNGVAPQCYYDDAAACIKNSNPPSFSCVVNADAALSYFGGQRYCTVDSNRVAQCLYDDHGQCITVARQTMTVCVERGSINGNRNPFQYDTRIQN